MLPGAHRVAFQRAGKWRVYWYAGRERGAERLGAFSAPTLAEAEAMERAAAREIAERYSALAKPTQAPGYMSSLIADFRRDALPRMAASTQKVWRGHLDAIETIFGDIPLKDMQRRGARAAIKRWHEGMSDKPRTANYRLTVLARVMSWAVDEERMDKNPAAGIGRLDEGPGRAAIIWRQAELDRLLSHCSPEVSRAVRLAALTGLRMGDVIDLNWSEVDGGMIDRPTLKSRRRRRVIIPIYADLRALLDECPKVGPKVITNSRGKPWKNGDAFDSSLRPALRASGVDKHFHDLRGTAATRMRAAGLTVAQIASAMGWSDAEAERIIPRYVDLAAVARGLTMAGGNQ